MATGVTEVCWAKPLVYKYIVIEPKGPAFLDSLLDDCYVIESSGNKDDMDETPYPLLYYE